MGLMYGALRPKDEESYKKMFWEWIQEMHAKYLDMDGKKYSEFAHQLFFIKSNHLDEKINPDIAGQMTQSIFTSINVLKIKENSESTTPTSRNIRKPMSAQQIGEQVENIEHESPNIKILMEIMKLQGKDLNVMDLFLLFKTILQKDALKSRKKSQNDYTEDHYKKMFLESLSELKYMGYLS